MRERPDSFIRSAGVISALTLLSRLLGVVRDIACAAVFGAGVVWDAFSFAFRIPNLFRRLFGEGALSAAFLPVFTEHLALNRPQEAWRLAGRVAGALALVLSGILLLGEAALAAMLGLMELSARWRLALMLTAVLLPYMVLICMTALAGAALNSMKRFAMPALAPVVLNACWIAAVLVAAPLVSARPEGRIMAVAAGILLAGVLQLWLQIAALRRLGVRLRLSFSLMHPQVRRVAAAMAPVALGLAAFQINVLLDGVIAISLAGPAGGESFRLFGATLPYPMEVGANSVLYYGNRLMQFPLGVFGIALATAVFPTLSHHGPDDGTHGPRAYGVLSGDVGLFRPAPAGAGFLQPGAAVHAGTRSGGHGGGEPGAEPGPGLAAARGRPGGGHLPERNAPGGLPGAAAEAACGAAGPGPAGGGRGEDVGSDALHGRGGLGDAGRCAPGRGPGGADGPRPAAGSDGRRHLHRSRSRTAQPGVGVALALAQATTRTARTDRLTRSARCPTIPPGRRPVGQLRWRGP